MKQCEYLIVAGGTGGHIFPAVAIYEELIKRGKTVQFVTDQRGEKFLVELDGKLIVLNLAPFKKSIFSLYKAVSLAYFAFIKMLIILFKQQPKQVIAFGGYPCLPVVIAAALMRKKIIIHEQNTVMGRMNRFSSYFADKILLGFRDTQLVPQKYISKTEFFPTPIRKKILAINKQAKSDKNFTILVIGGSQAASIFSEIIPQALKFIKDKLPKNFKLIQQCRNKEEYNKLNNFYIIEEIKAEVAEFFNDIELKLNQADIVIARSGASSISEIMALAKPAILIPLPSAMDNHQYFNAKFLSDKNAALMINQADLTAKLLGENILQLFDDKICSKMSDNLKLENQLILQPDFSKII